MADMAWYIDGRNYQNHHVTSLPQAQDQEALCVPFSQHWPWSMDTMPTSKPTWNTVPFSQPIQVVNDDHSFDSYPRRNDAGILLSTRVNNLTPSLDRNRFLGDPPAFLNPCTDHTSRGGSPMVFLGQGDCEEEGQKDEFYHQNPEAGPSVRLPPTSRRTRKPKQQLDRTSAEPLRCQWKGCRYSGSFKRESLLIRHLKKLHFYPGSHPCPIEDCDMVCNRADNLMQHMRNVHS